MVLNRVGSILVRGFSSTFSFSFVFSGLDIACNENKRCGELHLFPNNVSWLMAFKVLCFIPTEVYFSCVLRQRFKFQVANERRDGDSKSNIFFFIILFRVYDFQTRPDLIAESKISFLIKVEKTEAKFTQSFSSLISIQPKLDNDR